MRTWLIQEVDYGAGTAPTPIAPVINFDSTSITVTVGSPISNVVRWTDTDTTASNPIASVIQTAGPGAISGITNLALPSGSATWTHTATLADGEATITVEITDGDGLTRTASFTLNVNAAPPLPDGLTQCGSNFLPTTVSGTLANFADGILDITPGGNITPEWQAALNGTAINWSNPTDQNLLPNATCTYGEIAFLSIPANPDGTNSATINIGFELSWSENHPGNAGQETWMLATRVFTDDDGSSNGNESFFQTTLFTGPSEGFVDWPVIPVTWPPQYDGTLAIPQWGGEVNGVTDSHNSGNTDSPVSTLVIDNNPGNPSIVRLEATTVTSDSTFLAQEWHSVTVVTGDINPVEGPLPPVFDFTQFAGQTVTVSYWGIDSAGQQSVTVQETVVVPTFAAEKFCGPGETIPTLQGGIAALGPRERLTVRAGLYELGVNGEPIDNVGWSLNGKLNATIVFEPGAVLDQRWTGGQIIENGLPKSESPQILNLGTAQNCRVDGAELSGLVWEGIEVPPGSTDNVLSNITCDSVNEFGMLVMFRISGTRTIVENCHGENLILREASNIQLGEGPGGGTMVYIVGGATDTEVWGGTCIGINRVDGVHEGSRHGVFVQQSTTIGTRVRGFKPTNCIQGVLTSSCNDLRVYDCDLSDSRATGFQIEADSNTVGTYTKNIEVRRCLLNNDCTIAKGEAAGWINDAEAALFEDCIILDAGVSASRVDAANGRFSAAGNKTSKDVIMRFILIDRVGYASQGFQRSGLSFKGVVDSAFYNITILDVTSQSWTCLGIGDNHFDPLDNGVAENERNVLKNCIVGEIEDDADNRLIIVKDKNAFKDINNNFYQRMTANPNAYQITRTTSNKFNFTGYQGQMTPHEANSEEVTDLKLDANRVPLGDSPCKNAAAPMATVVSPGQQGLTVHLSDTTWIWVNTIRPENNDKIVFPNGTAKVVSKTTTTVTIDALPPGGISVNDEVRLLHKGARALGNYPGMAAGTADIGAMQS